jgi:hypothetical protein
MLGAAEVARRTVLRVTLGKPCAGDKMVTEATEGNRSESVRPIFLVFSF